MGQKTNVVIVGSGAAGSLLAARLAQSGRTVVILEAGPKRTLGDLYSSQIWARRQKWAGPATELAGQDPVSVAFNSGWGTGGSAMHHYAVWLRLHPEDFDMHSRFGQGLDWPIVLRRVAPLLRSSPAGGRHCRRCAGGSVAASRCSLSHAPVAGVSARPLDCAGLTPGAAHGADATGDYVGSVQQPPSVPQRWVVRRRVSHWSPGQSPGAASTPGAVCWRAPAP